MTKILFVCHGNICRSAAALYIMRDLVHKAGLDEHFVLDSAATSTEEIGNPVYPPMKRTLDAHGILCDGHRARQMRPQDYADYDLLIAMDSENIWYMDRMYHNDPEGKFRMLMDYTDDMKGREVADPWYTRDFERTYKDALHGCSALLESVRDSA